MRDQRNQQRLFKGVAFGAVIFASFAIISKLPNAVMKLHRDLPEAAPKNVKSESRTSVSSTSGPTIQGKQGI